MASVFPQRMTAEVDGDFVVFIIGMRINRPWKPHKWLPVFLAMPRMLRELASSPDSGFLGSIGGIGVIVQYWRSFEHLERYARNADQAHWPAWVDFNRRVHISSGDVGIWHETYLVRAGEYEAIYGSMPRYGLALAGRHVAAAGARESARGRLDAMRGAGAGGVRAPDGALGSVAGLGPDAPASSRADATG
jgi:hypothetical protein